MRKEAANRIRNLPPIARKMFEKRRDELEKTGELEKLHSSDDAVSGESLSPGAKLDIIVLSLGFLAFCVVLYVEYKIDVLNVLYRCLLGLLDPGKDPANS